MLRAQTSNLTALLQQGLFEEQANRNLDAAIADYSSLATQFDKNRQLAATAVFRLGECYRAQGKTNEAATQYQRILHDFSDQQTLATLSRQDLAGMGMPAATEDSVKRQLELKRQLEAAAAVENADAQLLKRLEGRSVQELEKILPTVVPDATLDDLLQKRNEAQSKRAALAVDYATNNPAVVRVDALVAELNRQIEEKIGGMMQGLKLRAELSPSPQSAGDARQQQKELLTKQIALAEQDLADTKKMFQAGKATQAEVRAAEREGLRLRQQLAALDVYRAELPELSVPASSEEDKEIARIKQMIQNSPDLINGNAIQGSPLGRAADAGQLRVAEFLLDNGADVNAPSDTAGKTPLLAAAYAGRKAMVELLLQRGANVNAANGQGQTALHQAVEQGFISVAEVLLATKADPNRQNEDTQTPLTIAARKGSRAMAALLLAHGADPNIARKVHPGYGANPLSEGRKMFGTPLHIAAARGDVELVALLLTNRADVKPLSLYLETPLQGAAACGKADVAELLLAAGADPNARADANASTPLHLAVSGGYRDVVERLLAHGANPNATATINRRDTTPLMLAATDGNDDIALLLLQRKADPNLKDDEGNTPLIRAIDANKVAVVRALLAHGANPEAKRAGEWPALIVAVAQRSPEMTAALLEAKADVNIVAGGAAQSALHSAAAMGSREIVQLLITAHANVNLRDLEGNTPLHLAVREGKESIVPLLLEAKADPNLRNSSGTTPLDFAKALESSGGRRPGMGIPGIPPPLSYQWNFNQPNNSGGQTATATNAVTVADLLRQHGAVDKLPDFTRIRITRQGVSQPYEVFYKKATLTNQFTLLETVMRFYSLSQVHVPGEGNQEAWRALPFPDFARIIIRRPSPKIGGKEQEIKVSLLNSSNVVDCARAVPVEFGDVIEIPESVHALNAETPNPVREMETAFEPVAPTGFAQRLASLQQQGWAERLARVDAYRALTACLQKSVQLVVAGETTTFKVNSWKEGFLSWALQKTEARSALRSSSDLSRITVTRKLAGAGQPAVFTVDVTGSSPNNDDLWLQDGDVITVPEKP
jgi:ankyrin repeat protein